MWIAPTLAVAVLLAVVAAVAAQDSPVPPPATEAAAEAVARFTMTPVDGGVLRLDTRTGALSRCGARNGIWACEVLPDDRSAYEDEIARLNGRIAALETQIARSAPRPPLFVPDIMEEPDKGERAGPPATVPPDAGAPTGEDTVRRQLDRGMDMAEHMFRRFMQMIDRLRREDEGKPL